ncbi:TetR/AcrR family transcriptional regulator [Qiania dongpingensis]|uniref:TetR/AcrR family transcriptional regulator n=1 Tax=Qiania dongpingensis TaxID=2763669 RepID=A0A7G9G774_9FIRM|nr:TetR/AcrR family transcriptional regulator [Qiania dongpingensis]QNM06656.1 TetR/AcrR family transcriptional regulator [Qiania dongpingensis]
MRRNSKKVSPMSNEGRNAYVIKHLTDAFLSLLAEKPLEDISISELVDTAGVGRASFYRNYERKEDILRSHLDTLFREWTDEWEEKDGAPLSEQVCTMIAHFEKHRSFYQLLNERGLIYMLKDAIIGICGPKPEYEKTQAYATAFVAYSLYGWIDVWFQRGMLETADEIAELFKAQEL